jgi:AraC-like DNA-binding protein
MSSITTRIFLHTGTEGLLWPPADSMTSTYQQAIPSPALRGYVERIYLGYERIPLEAPVEERVLPDGSIQLIFNLGDRPAEIAGGEGYSSEVLGARCGPAVIRMAGTVDQIGVQLRPGGIAPLLGVPASELAGGVVALESLWGARAAEALERLADARGSAARVTVIEGLLLDLLGRRDAQPHALAAEAVGRITAAGGRIRIRDLAATLGVGERRLEQVFHQHVGLSPKVVCRLARFRASVSLLHRQRARSWSEIAYECGYYDQSHLINEFQAVAGLAPESFRERTGFAFLQDGTIEPSLICFASR